MGWTYNTLDPDAPTMGPAIAAVGIAFTALSLVVVGLRMYVRRFLVKAVGADDWVMVFTWFMSLGFMVVSTIQSKWGLGLFNLTDMPDGNLFNFGLLQYCGAPFYILSILGFKLSLLLMFLRIAVEKWYRLIVMIIAGSCTAFHLSFLIAQLNLCQPVAQQWDPEITTGSCLPAVPFYTSMASITIVFDVIIMLTPFPMLLKAQLPRRKKIVLLCIFSLGIFITVIQLIRILTIKSLANYINSSRLILWSMVENNLGIIVGSIPALAPLFRSFRDHTTHKSSGHASGQRGPYALQDVSYGNGRKGLVALGSGHDVERESPDLTTTVGYGGMDSSSEELNERGIYKTTEVTIDHEAKALDYGR